MTISGSSEITEKIAMSESFDVASSYAMQLSLMEIGLGSLLHAFHVPFSGFFLSLNQIFVLNRALIVSESTSLSLCLPTTISNTAAILKTLSPYGKKFTPMLAISMQGLLFNIGTIFGGKNLLGRCLGSFLLSFWPMVQPVLVYGIIYGSLFFSMGDYYTQLITKLPWVDDFTIQAIIAGYVFVHLFLSLVVCLLTSLLPTRMLDRYDRYIATYRAMAASGSTKGTFLHKLKGVWKDLTSPLFLLSLVLSGFFLYATVHSLGTFFFLFFRLVAVAFLTFFLLRNIPAEWCIRVLSKSYFFKRCAPYVEEVLRRIQKG